MLAQYYPINSRDEGGNGPAPMALGKYGLAEAAQIIRDGVKHMFYGHNRLQLRFHLAARLATLVVA